MHSPLRAALCRRTRVVCYGLWLGCLGALCSVRFFSFTRVHAFAWVISKLTRGVRLLLQNDPKVFEYFLEHNMIEYFDSFLGQNAGTFINTQLLQTLMMILDNIDTPTSIWCMRACLSD